MKRVSVVGVIHNGKLLLGKRRDNGRYTTPGGHLEEGEDPLAGGARELEEESGIKVDPKELVHVKTKTVTKPDGTKIVVYAYRLDLDDRRSTTMRGDPDGEVHRWHWFDMRALPEPLHVPYDENVLLQAMGDEVAMKKTAFWVGFEKQALGMAFAPGAVLREGAGALKKKLVSGAGQAYGHVGSFITKRPATAAALGAGAAGFAAGRATS